MIIVYATELCDRTKKITEECFEKGISVVLVPTQKEEIQSIAPEIKSGPVITQAEETARNYMKRNQTYIGTPHDLRALLDP